MISLLFGEGRDCCAVIELFIVRSTPPRDFVMKNGRDGLCKLKTVTDYYAMHEDKSPVVVRLSGNAAGSWRLPEGPVAIIGAFVQNGYFSTSSHPIYRINVAMSSTFTRSASLISHVMVLKAHDLASIISTDRMCSAIFSS